MLKRHIAPIKSSMPKPRRRTTRRSFIKSVAATTAGGIVFPNLLLAQEGGPAIRRVAIAVIGCGGSAGGSDISQVSAENEIVAICDVDSKPLIESAKRFTSARVFRDFREMLDKVKNIEAVSITVPDHAHYPAAMHALALGKHVCVQKPLANTLWECREMHLAAKKKGVITQMGNQGHSYHDMRVVQEWIAAGAIGKPKEAHVWTNRPIWPQGKEVTFKRGAIPNDFDWPLWLAATPDHAYSPDIHPFKWRGFIEWGTGALGDMGCHLLDGPATALELGVPKYITALEVNDITNIAWPNGAIVKMEFPGTPKHGDITLFWYEGTKPNCDLNVPEVPEGVNRWEAFPREIGPGTISDNGWYIIGTEGLILNNSHLPLNPQLWPRKRREDFLANPPPKTLPRSPKPSNPHQEWTLAIKNGKPFPFMSQFDYSAPLTELTLLGGLSMHFVGKRLEWNSSKLEVVGMPEASKFIKRHAYRKGWEYSNAKI